MNGQPYTLYLNHARRLALEIDANPKFKRVIRIQDRGGLDIVNMTDGELQREGFFPADPVTCPHGALRFALTFSRSELAKTDRAARMLDEVKKHEMKQLTVDTLAAEYARLTGRPYPVFKNRAAGVKALTLASAMKNVADASASTKKENTMSDATTTNGTTPKTTPPAGTEAKKAAKKPGKVAVTKPAAKAAKKTAPAKPAAKSTAKPAKNKPAPAAKAKREKAPSMVDPLARAKAVAKMTEGSGGMIVGFLKAGKMDHDQIVSAVLKKFPDRKVNATQVAWYKSQLVKAKAIK
jgi:hypothetical protein